ncbi:alpha/beta fold hydrolase [Novosphingobium sp. AP12]|uniref:alpha/beta fold hydrolase n=1 Tax=Novosphingobium sp. AP12 TaxID=1144305 RepID=UPI0002720B44|nr:alpha/beta hydrolase [Novosphingobium sp. AP12]EJL22584.1 putative hydrolase or acyltransferase of alpha/beta superfamily [Novosphingobium sp. AP12]
MSCFAKLHGRRSGTGQTAAILSHGFGTDQDAWSALRPWFEERFDVISFDLPGCGPGGAESYDFDRHGSMFGYADDLIELIDELGLQDTIFVGHSMSGMIGAAAACARPDLFARLVMIGASPRYLNDGGYVGGFEQEGLDQLFASMAANFQAWVAGFAPMVVGVDDSEAVADFSRTLFQMRPDVALNTSRTIFGSDMRATARRVPTPVHLVQAASDVAVPREVGDWLAAAIPNATLDVISASGHLPHMTAPAEVLAIVERRLAGAWL